MELRDFTTRSTGQGTGRWLYTKYKMLKQNMGLNAFTTRSLKVWINI